MSSNLDLLKQNSLTWEQPRCFEVSEPADLSKLQREIDQATSFFDPMSYAIEELYDIAYPQEKDLPKEQNTKYQAFAEQHAWPKGVFVYFPWDKTLIRFPGKDDLRALRTSRNRNLITADEQKQLYKETIFIAGLSVGSNIVEAMVSMGIGGKFIIADMDVIEPTNLNRIRSPYKDVGTNKVDAIAMRMNQIDPYLEFVVHREGVTQENLIEIMDTHKPTIVVDEMDQVELKIRLRKEAKARGIPLLSAADDGDSALLDIERYDIKDTPLFNGLIPEDIIEYIESFTDMPRNQLGLLIGKYFVGSENIPLRMYQSLAEVGKTLPSWPQLGGAAAQSGIVVAYAARKIILKQALRGGRFVIGPEPVLDPALESESHKTALNQFQKQLDDFKLSEQ